MGVVGSRRELADEKRRMAKKNELGGSGDENRGRREAGREEGKTVCTGGRAAGKGRNNDF